ncbi:MAG: OmpA family protein [Alphaproteobacteria bacterium]|nr:OmpA family protein [Alphaproteobacteria bacterium]
MKLSRFLLSGALALLLANCAYVDIDNVRGMEPQGTDFTKALFAEYVTLADEEVAEFDWDNAGMYASKAQVVGGGEAILPNDPANHELPADMMGDFNDGRARLIAALDAGARDIIPVDAAHAQAMYDCWIEEQEEGHQPEDIARCKNAFWGSLAVIEAAIKPAPEMAAEEPMEEPAWPGPYIIYFGFDRDDIAESATSVISEIAAQIAAAGPSKVTVYGHTDRAGSDDYNLDLSRRRADNVAAALAGAGVSGDLLEIMEFGESTPLVPTDDGVRNPENRRVEITLVP